jgi:hypothetical protein
LRLWSLLILVLAFFIATAALSTSQNPPLHLPTPPPLDDKSGPDADVRSKMEKDMAKKANLARQEDLKRDTEKLVKLANELKEDVDKTTASTLSVNVVKKAEEIEKLAHSVKEKMKGSY